MGLQRNREENRSPSNPQTLKKTLHNIEHLLPVAFLSHSILKQPYFYFHFIDGETEAQLSHTQVLVGRIGAHVGNAVSFHSCLLAALEMESEIPGPRFCLGCLEKQNETAPAPLLNPLLPDQRKCPRGVSVATGQARKRFLLPGSQMTPLPV